MAITVSKTSGQGILPGVGALQQFKCTLDNSWLAAGENVDLTSYFTHIYSIQTGGSTAISGYKLDFILPAQGTAITASNVKMTAHYSTDAAGAMTAVPDATDISTIGPVQIVVIGKPKVAS
jgi:hypothetical protein